ncbi:MAG: hypothetical protein ACOX9R_16515 [Armatimonadota bacterium]|jgi:hypothetical protein
MSERERGRISGCGRLLIIAGLCAAGVALLAWLIKLELRGEPSGSIAVWITDSGSRYHRRECAALARSHPREVTLAQAKAQGLGPCDLCGPPA